MGHADGRCCAYVHSDADLDMARTVITDSKCDYPAACNSLETLLIHESLLSNGKLIKILQKQGDGSAGLIDKGVELRCEEDIYEVLKGHPHVVKATDEDIVTEFLDLRIYVRTVKSVDEGTASLKLD